MCRQCPATASKTVQRDEVKRREKEVCVQAVPCDGIENSAAAIQFAQLALRTCVLLVLLFQVLCPAPSTASRGRSEQLFVICSAVGFLILYRHTPVWVTRLQVVWTSCFQILGKHLEQQQQVSVEREGLYFATHPL